MLIKNLNLRKQLGLGKLMEADAGAGVSGADNTGNDTTDTTDQADEIQEKETQKTFTQKDVDKLIQDRIAREQAKWEKKVQEEKTEAEKLAKMKADEKAKYQEEKKLKELEQREKDITTRELRATALETLAEKNIPKELAEVLNYESAETCNASIEAVEKAFQSAVEKQVNEKLRGSNPPKGNGGTQTGTTFGFNFTGVRPKK